jgi:hypothetical protein
MRLPQEVLRASAPALADAIFGIRGMRIPGSDDTQDES